MKHQWDVHTATPDCWNVFYGPALVAELVWIRTLVNPALTMARVRDGLNGLHPDVPAREWTIGAEHVPGRHDICHTGEVVAELAWRRTVRTPDVWLARMLAGLNWRSNATRTRPPTPAAPARPTLRRVS